MTPTVERVKAILDDLDSVQENLLGLYRDVHQCDHLVVYHRRRSLCAAVGPTWTSIDDAITQTARHLGFARTGDNIRTTLETAINSAVNKGELEKRGGEVRVKG